MSTNSSASKSSASKAPPPAMDKFDWVEDARDKEDGTAVHLNAEATKAKKVAPSAQETEPISSPSEGPKISAQKTIAWKGLKSSRHFFPPEKSGRTRTELAYRPAQAAPEGPEGLSGQPTRHGDQPRQQSAVPAATAALAPARPAPAGHAVPAPWQSKSVPSSRDFSQAPLSSGRGRGSNLATKSQSKVKPHLDEQNLPRQQWLAAAEMNDLASMEAHRKDITQGLVKSASSKTGISTRAAVPPQKDDPLVKVPALASVSAAAPTQAFASATPTTAPAAPVQAPKWRVLTAEEQKSIQARISPEKSMPAFERCEHLAVPFTHAEGKMYMGRSRVDMYDATVLTHARLRMKALQGDPKYNAQSAICIPFDGDMHSEQLLEVITKVYVFAATLRRRLDDRTAPHPDDFAKEMAAMWRQEFESRIKKRME
ncbi:hypothetical protein MCOR25_009273 [Pyricularia grisea]|uniref:Uncharacterized protein n=1 Tax=Pyricularia grisea TaxID=148305 RepID=A0A6P8BAY0_PYRGI|nr:uncharacterized protein PgNI_02649 [Pyricularia grisea]KAI6352889.1 hypothetical protein MCOR25_009273 [Pyricularia grisea]TLD12964.1 hypothetical protein PgNI_02649 [Pyricularia grisea]